MKNWEYKKLGDCCVIQNGYAFDSKFFTTEKKGLPLIRIRDIKRGFSETFYSSDFPEEYIVHKGDFLIGMDGEFNIGEWKSEDALLNQRVCRIKCDETKVLNRYIYYLIPTELKKIEDVTTYTTVKHLSSKQISEMNLPLPPLEEQKRIVKILDEKFAQLETVKANAKANLQNAKDLFQSQLTKAFSNTTWEKKVLLKDIAKDFSRGKSKHRPRNDKCLFGGNYPFIQTGDIRNTEKYITEYTDTYNETGLAQSKLWPEGTLCITIAANIAETAILTFPCCFPDSVIGFVPNEDIATADYVFYLLQFFKAELQVLGKGAAQDNINLGTFEKMQFPLPPLPEQKRIVEQLDSLSEKVRSLEEIYTKQLANCDELKQAFLAKAFNGEL